MFGLSRANEFTEKFMNIIKAKVLIICDVDKVIFISVMLSSIGIFAGILSGFVGVGGGIIIVPGLVFLLGLTLSNLSFIFSFVLFILSLIFYKKILFVNYDKKN